jgi:polyhydroxyalkanoate synthesis regulator phasin
MEGPGLALPAGTRNFTYLTKDMINHGKINTDGMKMMDDDVLRHCSTTVSSVSREEGKMERLSVLTPDRLQIPIRLICCVSD